MSGPVPQQPPALRVAVTIEQVWHAVPGGTATSVLRTMEELAGRPALNLVGVAAYHQSPPPQELAPPMPVAHLPLPRRAMYEAWHGVRWPPAQFATGAVDVVHATTSAIPPKRGPMVVTVHDLAFLRAPEHFTRHGNRFFRRGLELTRRDADLVVVPSSQTGADCVDAGIDAARIRLVPHGVRITSVSADQRAETRSRLGLDRPYVLWCGTREPRKNLHRLVTAFARVAEDQPDLDLVLVGPVGWGDAGVSDLDTGRVRVLGFVPEADLQALYAEATVFCYPSLWEGFGMPVLEAMAHAVPVVTSSGSPMAELVGDAGIVVEPTDVDALSAALIEALGPAGQQLGARAQSRAARYTWRESADLTMQAYREVTGT